MGLGRILAVSGGAVVGALGAVKAVPSVLGSAGFTSDGVAAGSLAASMISATTANRGGVAAGSLLAFLQSAGAAGLSANANAAVATVGGSIGAGLVESFLQYEEEKKTKKEEKFVFLAAAFLVLCISFVFLNEHGPLVTAAAASVVAGVGWLAKVCWEESEKKRREEEMWGIAGLALVSFVYLNSRGDRDKNTK